MPGFLTTHDQQQIRRFLKRLPLRALVYVCAIAGWYLGPAAEPSSASQFRMAGVTGVGVLLLAVLEFGLTLHAEGLWAGPPWARHVRGRRWVAPLSLASVAAVGGVGLHWALAVEQPMPIFGILLVVALLTYGTLHHTMRQPVESEPIPPALALDQMRLMAALSARAQPVRTDAEMRSAILAVLIDQPDNRAARLLAWQLALKDGDLSDAEHNMAHLRRLGFPERDLMEMEALWALTADQPARAADALDRRVALVHENPRTTPAGQRADFVAALHLAHSLARASLWPRAAECLDGLGRDYESAPFVGQLDRLIVNHLRWQAARELATEEVARDIEDRCRRFARRTVRAAARRHIPKAEAAAMPDAIRWWPRAARAAVAWWEEARRRS
jgi:hypothetical protein